MSDDPLKPGGALEGSLFRGFLRRLAEAREPEAGDRIGAWQIIRELGRGGTGVVFLAERADGAFNQQVALKWLRADRPVPGGREMLARERELLSSLDHPSIARLIDGGETEDGMLWFAMDHVDGETIDRHATNLDLHQRLRLVETLCRAVQHAHRRGLIHGDIKPSNVLVDERARPRLVDFGISRIKGAASGFSYGLTPDYASPEQRRREPLTTASDIWQLGRLLDDLIDGARVPGDLRAIVIRATADSPEDRYFSAAAMGADIDAWLNGRPVTAHRGGAGYRFARFIQRNLLVSAVTGAALAIIIGGGAWMALQLAEERDTARAEAARAEAALADAEAELARAEGLREFLIGLFRATRPDRPRDQLPTTEELLDSGARRAMDDATAPDADRIGMLTTIADVYINLGMADRAEPLIDEALALARVNEEDRPEDLARALVLKGVVTLHLRSGESGQAGELFTQAEKAAAGLDRARDVWMHARTRRAWLRHQVGETREAMALLEPVVAQIDAGADAVLSDDSRLRLANTLGGIHQRLGEFEKSLAYSREAAELSSRIHGSESRNHAIKRANLAAVQLMLGDFDPARDNLDLALELYQRIYGERPVNYRAAALNSRAVLNMYAGRYEQALADSEAAFREWAGFQEIEPEDYRWRDHHLGWLLLRMQRLEEARPHLRRAAERFSDDSSPTGSAVMSRARLALAHCRLGDAVAGREALAELENWPDPADLAYQAEIIEARAACLHADGRQPEALETIDASLDQDTPAGEAMLRAQRLDLRSDILEAMGRSEAAAQSRTAGRNALFDAGLDEHPALESLSG